MGFSTVNLEIMYSRAMRRILSIFALLVGLASCSGADVINGLTPEDGFSLQKDLAYGASPRQKLDIYYPPKISNKTPVVVFFYGGSWQWGSKSDYLFVGEALTSMGYIAVIPDYRLAPEVKYPAFIEDSAMAVTWVHKNIGKSHANPNNLFLIGHSAGAYNAVMLGLDRRYMQMAGGDTGWIKGIVGISGPYNFLPLRDPKIKNVFSSEADLRKTQPITYARPGAPPMFLATGKMDSVVHPRNSYTLYMALQELGNDVTYKEYDQLSHETILVELTPRFSNRNVLREDVQDFIEDPAKIR